MVELKIVLQFVWPQKSGRTNDVTRVVRRLFCPSDHSYF